ncbi:hypothetical protein BGZ58_001590, partial [Dissophora ornata]
MAPIRKLGFLLAAASVLSQSLVARTEAAACKADENHSAAFNTPLLTSVEMFNYGHCGNSPLACGVGCDATASFNGVCQRYVAADAFTADSKRWPVPTLPKGAFKVIGNSGVTAQHIALVTPTKMLIIDRAEDNPPKLPSGNLAYNAEYDLVKNEYRVLEVQTNTFCSGGGFLPNGTMISAGGAEMHQSSDSGFQSLRMWNPCNDDSCGWIENPQDPAWTLTSNRWYVSITSLPSGKLFVLGGSTKSLAVNFMETNNPTWEIYPKPAGVKAADYKPNFMQFMVDALPNNLYPNVYSLPDGNIYIFANQKSMIFNVERNEVIKHLPPIPGGPRSYPLTGSHVLLPLDPAKNYAHEVLVCGGSEAQLPRAKALQTCGRINLNDVDPQWEMDEMPTPRLMGDALILADGKIMILNGCQAGYAGFHHGKDPVYTPTIYDPEAPLGSRFQEW